MNSANLFGPPGAHRQLDDGQRRRIRREHRMRSADAVELGEQLLLRLEVLDDRFDDEIAFCEPVEVGDRDDARQRRLACFCGELALLHLLGERALEPGQRRIGRRLGAAPECDVIARLGGHFGDARSHDSGSDDPDPLLHHHSSLTRCGAGYLHHWLAHCSAGRDTRPAGAHSLGELPPVAARCGHVTDQ